jgi:hypothetical protein
VFAGRFAAKSIQSLQAQTDSSTVVNDLALESQSNQAIGVDVALLESKYGISFVPVDPAQLDIAVVTAEEAIAEAQRQKGKTKEASRVTADLGYLGNASEAGQTHSDLQETPLVWVLNFEGVLSYSSCEPAPGCVTYVSDEYVVIIDAVSGQWIMGLTM